MRFCPSTMQVNFSFADISRSDGEFVVAMSVAFIAGSIRVCDQYEMFRVFTCTARHPF